MLIGEISFYVFIFGIYFFIRFPLLKARESDFNKVNTTVKITITTRGEYFIFSFPRISGNEDNFKNLAMSQEFGGRRERTTKES